MTTRSPSPRDLLRELRVSRETVHDLERYQALLMTWSRTMNLVAPSTISELWQRHILDSAQLFLIENKPLKWMDIGSGGGLPGIVIGVLQKQFGGEVDLVESNKKKSAFLRVCLQELSIKGRIHPNRLEDVVGGMGEVDCISCRAMASLADIFSYLNPLLRRRPSIRLLLHKGRDYEREVQDADRHWSFSMVKHQSVVDPESVILEISSVSNRITS